MTCPSDSLSPARLKAAALEKFPHSTRRRSFLPHLTPARTKRSHPDLLCPHQRRTSSARRNQRLISSACTRKVASVCLTDIFHRLTSVGRPDTPFWGTPAFPGRADAMLESVLEFGAGGVREIRIRHCSDVSLCFAPERAQARGERSLVRILVVVANIQMRALKAEVGKGSM
ncbi:hypothetical protein KSP40_PGU008399 [Platanthera guangdongensis]|uniref:Uncharacterized protein n=1 Tax=Platanthera guangdongensis TaxID=2320717 RepID=A0ABR2M339_9ASPA